MSRPWTRFHAWWNNFWFGEGSPYDLAAARIVVSLHALWLLASRDLPAVSGLPEEFWASVQPMTQWRYLLFHGHPTLEYLLQAGAVIALMAAAVGLYPRVSCLAASILLYHLAPLETIFATPEPVTRGFGIGIIALAVLSFSPCADVWSMSPRRPPTTVCLASKYQWSLRLVQMLVVQVYFFSGYAKMYWGGLDWMSAGSLRNLILVRLQRSPVEFEAMGYWLAGQPTLLLGAAMVTVVFELLFPMVLFIPSSRRIFIPLAAGFHLGIMLTMNLFYPGIPHLLVFVNWVWLRKLVHSLGRVPRRAAASVPRG